MRLINSESLVLEEFMGGGSQVPEYAILSHTWDKEEVSFQDYIHSDREAMRRKQGFQKIEKTCRMARTAGLYLWVDTCCIDNTSSAELTEAINSMFQWYRDATICYTWLADLPGADSLSPENPHSCFKDCRWFTRGWTLQELIAPTRLMFYDQDWTFRGTKRDLDLVVSRITKIDVKLLRNAELLYDVPIAQRMSWAASRHTTRVEDMAYCLLGIFDVNMPMLYGEGPKAFIRLQEEIIRQSNDLSLFAWRAAATDQLHHGILAGTPSEFRDSESIALINGTTTNPDFVMTNKGLRITVELHPTQNGTYLMTLNCSQPDGNGGNKQIGILIKMHGGGVYSRVQPDQFGVVDSAEVGKPTKITSLFLSKRINSNLSCAMDKSHRGAFLLRKGFGEKGVAIDGPGAPFAAVKIRPEEHWDSQRRMFLTRGASTFTACFVVMARALALKHFTVAFGLTEDSVEPWIAVDSGSELMRHLLDLKKLGEVGSRLEKRRETVQGRMGYPSMQVDVSLERVTLDGQEVFCVDILYSQY